MGTPDTITKQYMEDNRIFADAFNFFIYGGKPVIQPEQLRPLNAIATATLDNGKSVQKARDELKCLIAMEDNERAYVILGIENQSEVHYAMPVRNLLYDALTYDKQVKDIASNHNAEHDHSTNAEFLSGFHKEDRLIPVITLVVYFGANQWDAPTSLHEMMRLDEADESLKELIDNYKIKLIAPAQLVTEDFAKFHTNLRHVLEFIKYSKDKQHMAQLMNNKAYSSMDENAVQVIEHCTHLKLKRHVKNEKEEVNMCQAIDEMIEDGRLEGEAKGKAAGKEERSAEIAKSMLQAGKLANEDIAESSGLSLETVQILAEELAVAQ